MDTYKGPKRMAHRGLVQSAPENTIAAFEAAIQYGCEGIELDLRISKDGEVIVAHDGNFTRMSLGHPTSFTTKRLSDMTWEEISNVQLPYANHLLDEVPPKGVENETLAIMPERVLGQVPNHDYTVELERDPRMTSLVRFQDFDRWFSACDKDVWIEIEVKAAGVAQRLSELLAQSKNCDRYLVFSGNTEYNREIQRHLGRSNKPKGLRLGANIRFLNEETRTLIQDMDLFEVGLNAGQFTANDVQWLRSKGISVFSNLGDYPAWWAQLEPLGVLGFKTNYAQAFTKWYETGKKDS